MRSWLLAALLCWPVASGAQPVPENLRRRLPHLEVKGPAAALLSDLSLLPARPPQTGEPLTLADCYRIAFENQPTLLSAQAQVAQAAARLQQQYALYAPSLSFQYGRNVSRERSLTGTPVALPGGIADTTNLGLQLNHTLLDFGYRKNLVAAYRESLRAALYTWQLSWVNQVQTIQQAYVEALRAEYLLSTNQNNLARTELFLNIAERFYLAGAKSRIDVTQAEVQVQQARVLVVGARNQVRNARIALAQTLGIPAAQLENRVLQDEIFNLLPLPTPEAALQQLPANPQVESLNAQIRFNTLSREATYAQLLPTLSGTAGYGVNGVQVPLDVQNWTVGLTMSFPFFTPNVEPTADLFEATALQFRQDRETALLELRRDLETSFANVEGADDRITSAGRQVEVALENFRTAYRRYAAGLSDITELINARSFVIQAQTDYINALHDRKLAEGILLRTQSYQPEPRINIDPADPEK